MGHLLLRPWPLPSLQPPPLPPQPHQSVRFVQQTGQPVNSKLEKLNPRRPLAPFVVVVVVILTPQLMRPYIIIAARGSSSSVKRLVGFPFWAQRRSAYRVGRRAPIGGARSRPGQLAATATAFKGLLAQTWPARGAHFVNGLPLGGWPSAACGRFQLARN